MAVNSPNNSLLLMPSKAKNGAALVNEKIDERILRILGLVDVFDIDYDTYISLLKERMAAARMAKKTLATEETEMLTNEFKRVKGKKGKGRFKVKKITADSFKKGTATGINLKKQNLLPGIKPLALPPSVDKMSGKNDIQEIIDLLGEIVGSLTQQNKLQKDSSERSRKDAENTKRRLTESNLEKGFGAAIKVAEKIVAPVKSLLKRIIDFFVAIFLGNLVLKLLNWFADKNNQDKIRAIGRFFSDHWPKLLALYIRFGTGLGKFVGGLTKVVFFGMRKLLQVVAQVAGAKGAARFLGGKGGKLVAAGLQVATTVGTTMALSSGIENFTGLDNAGPEVEPPKFSGGGFASFKNLFGYLGGGPGYVSGQKGVDKVPAMLSDGEFVMSRGAVAKYGVDTLESMNAAGGGTNRPRMMKGTTYAAGGGYIGKKDGEGFSQAPDGRNITIGNRKEELNQRDIVNRLKRIEEQMQVRRALASGKGIDIKGAGFGSDIGRGIATTFMGREAIKVSLPPGGSYENEITLAGKRYFAMKRGNNILYVSNFAKGLAGQVNKYGARNKSYVGGGGGLMSGLSDKDKKNLPKTKIMMGPDGPFVGYLSFRNGEPTYQRPTQRKKGMLESLADFFDPKGARSRQETLNARTLRITGISDLEDMRRRGMKEENIKKMLNERLGANGYSRAVNDLKAKQARIKREEEMKKISGSSSAATGNTNIGISGLNKPRVSNLGSDYKQQELKLAAAANKPKLKAPSPPVNPKVSVKPKYSGGQRGSGSKPSTGGKPKTPNFGATCPSSNASKNKKILGIF